MGLCIYCGKPAGFFHREHKECAERHAIGRTQIGALLSSALTSVESAESTSDKARAIAVQCSILDQEFQQLAAEGWSSAFADAMDNDGIDVATEARLSQLKEALNLSQTDLDHAEARSRILAIGRTRITALLSGALTSVESAESISKNARAIAVQCSIRDYEFQRLTVAGWCAAVEHCLDDGGIDAATEAKLGQLKEVLNLTQTELDKHGAYSRVAKAAVLRDIAEGKMPNRFKIEGVVRINLQKNEQIVWAFNGVQLLEDKVVRQYVGGSQGVSVRLMKGVYYRVGAFKGHAVDHTERAPVDIGQVFITNRNIYFSGQTKSMRVPYQKVVSFQPFSDGIGMVRDTANAKFQVMITGDGWFTYNLVMSLSHFEVQRAN